MLRLKRALTAKGMTTRECAALLNISEKTMYNKIVGANEFSYGEAQKLRSILPEYNIDYLLGEETPLTPSDHHNGQ